MIDDTAAAIERMFEMPAPRVEQGDTITTPEGLHYVVFRTSPSKPRAACITPAVFASGFPPDLRQVIIVDLRGVHVTGRARMRQHIGWEVRQCLTGGS